MIMWNFKSERIMEEKQEEETRLSGMMDEWESLSLQLEESV